MKNVCKDLKIAYGSFIDGEFITHDFRHNFGTDILRNSDIETARELLVHSNITQTGTYILTDSERLTAAVRARDKIDYDTLLLEVLNNAKNGIITDLMLCNLLSLNNLPSLLDCRRLHFLTLPEK